MWTAIILLTAMWLIAAPAVLGFSTPALLGSVLSGLLVGAVALMRRWGDNRFFWIAMLGLYNVLAGFAYGGEARWSALAAGIVLMAAGLMALKASSRESPPAEGPATGSTTQHVPARAGSPGGSHAS